MTTAIITPTVAATYELKKFRCWEGARFGLRGKPWGTVVTVTVKNGRRSLPRAILWRYGGGIGRLAPGTPRLDIELLLRVRSPTFTECDPRFHSPRFGDRELVLEEWDRGCVDRWIYDRIERIPPGAWGDITNAMMGTFWVYVPDDRELIDEPAPEGFGY